MASEALESGLAVTVRDFAVRGLVCAIPAKKIGNEAFHAAFGESAVADVVKMIGVHTRHQAGENQTSADLCQAAADCLLAELGWGRDSVDALIFISQTPDYRLPATACALQARLGLKNGCAAFDVNLGCSGYVYGLWLASRLLDGQAVKRVLLLAGDTISKTVNPQDRATALLFGDAGSATALEFDDHAPHAHFILGTDGAGEKNLIIAHGAYKRYDGSDARLEGRDPACLYMDGGEIFNFTLKRVPQLVADLVALSCRGKEDIDLFLFHQANTFMLKHIVKKSKIAAERAPINMDRYGNTSIASIPLLMAEQLPSSGTARSVVAMVGFGVGYSWSAALLDTAPLAVNRIIEV